MLQDIVVAVVALGAATLVLRRVLGFVRPTAAGSTPGCDHCATGGKTPAAGPAGKGDEHPLVFIKSPRS